MGYEEVSVQPKITEAEKVILKSDEADKKSRYELGSQGVVVLRDMELRMITLEQRVGRLTEALELIVNASDNENARTYARIALEGGAE